MFNKCDYILCMHTSLSDPVNNGRYCALIGQNSKSAKTKLTD